ncbi:MAG TPA: 50S ribosomal protein L11 methyltransferase [Parafilimonas sp.]|nr:50S ribosomal protein L11 methyltransferase [Parafilimonas sp.]
MQQGHLQYTFYTGEKYLREILIAELAAIGFDGFEEKDDSLLAFISIEENNDAVEAIIRKYNVAADKTFIAEQNWNELWESNFQPVIINDHVAVRAEFHQPVKNVLHEIIITPKMSFGTGHHATTYMMIEQMCELDFLNKMVFDFGTGTGLLAILAEKLGATNVIAVDNDERCIENAAENIRQNNCNKIQLALSDKPTDVYKCDMILANINKNIIFENFFSLHEMMQPGAQLLLSGLLTSDEAPILQRAEELKLRVATRQEREGWILLQLSKN